MAQNRPRLEAPHFFVGDMRLTCRKGTQEITKEKSGRAVPALWLSRPSGGTPLPLCGRIFSQVQFTAIYCNLPRSPPSPVLSVLSELMLEINDLRGFVNLARSE